MLEAMREPMTVADPAQRYKVGPNRICVWWKQLLEYPRRRSIPAAEAARRAFEHIDAELHRALEAQRRNRDEIEQLRAEVKGIGDELNVTRRDRELLRSEATRVPELQCQLENIRSANRRHFELRWEQEQER